MGGKKKRKKENKKPTNRTPPHTHTQKNQTQTQQQEKNKTPENPKPSGEKFLSIDTRFHIQHWFHFHHMPFPKQTASLPVNREV